MILIEALLQRERTGVVEDVAHGRVGSRVHRAM